MEENKSRKQKLKEAWKYWTQPFWLLQHFIALCLAIIALVVNNNLAKNYVMNRQARQDAIVSSVISDQQRRLDEAAKLAASTTRAKLNIKPIRERFETTKAVDSQNSSTPDYSKSPEGSENQGQSQSGDSKTTTRKSTTKKREASFYFSENVIIVDPNDPSGTAKNPSTTTAPSSSVSQGGSNNNTSGNNVQTTKQTTPANSQNTPAQTTKQTSPQNPTNPAETTAPNSGSTTKQTTAPSPGSTTKRTRRTGGVAITCSGGSDCDSNVGAPNGNIVGH